ncbi:MAG: radical SAM protein [Candidatus Lokiarchaeota archaeon]|nr:radical SAM protein [Candidatus Lokiarchaeota archaeon]
MSNINNLLKKFESGTQTWSDYDKILGLDYGDLEPFLKLAYNLKRRNFGNLLKIYIPNKKFPAISITGSECSLHCEHCNKKYLDGMKPILNNHELKTYLMDLHNNDGIGFLLSGGCLPDGSVPLMDYLDTIKEIKTKTNLIINTHTGLINEETARKLSEVGVDIVSFDINMDEDIIKEIYHLDKNLEDYKRAINYLQKYNINIVPHICIGLYYGKLHKELESIKFIKESGLNPSLIVLIALIPPENAKKKFTRPKPIDIAKIVSIIRFAYPNSEISLGCMRPRGNVKIEIEKYAIKAGINRIEIPSKNTLKWAKELYPNINYNFFSACCAIPNEFEKLALSKDSELKNYQK